MDRKLHLVVALAAGLLGGLLSRYMTPNSVHAQASAPAPKEIQAQSFTIVDAQGDVIGTFKPSMGGARGQGRTVVLVDPSGREVWRASGISIRPLSQ